MDNFELNYREWLRSQEESSASTRARREVALGLRTPTGMGSLHGHSTAAPWEVRNISKKLKKGKKKVVTKSPDAPKVDTWLQELEALSGSVKKLKDVLDKKKKTPKAAVPKTPPKEEPKDKEKPESKPEDMKSDKEQWHISKKKPENSKEV